MKINIILPSIGHSGGIDVVYKYVNLFINRGHDVLVYKELKAVNINKFHCSFKNKMHQIYCTIKAFYSSYNSKENDKYVWEISDKSVRDADAIIATSWPTAFIVSRLSQSKGKKFYFIQDFEVWYNKERGMESYKLPLNKIVISTWINNKLKKEMGLGPFPIVMNGIDSSRFYTDQQFKNLKKDFRFLMLNHPLKRKGIKYGLAAYERVHNLYPNTKLTMFGKYSAYSLPSYVEYICDPGQDLLLKIYNESDIFIFPSLEEGWGLTPLEAMACGCAVVGTNTGFVLDLGIHRKNMMISTPGNVDEMYENICELIENRELLFQIVKGGYQTVSRLKWEKSAERFEYLLFKVNEEKM